MEHADLCIEFYDRLVTVTVMSLCQCRVTCHEDTCAWRHVSVAAFSFHTASRQSNMSLLFLHRIIHGAFVHQLLITKSHATCHDTCSWRHVMWRQRAVVVQQAKCLWIKCDSLRSRNLSGRPKISVIERIATSSNTAKASLMIIHIHVQAVCMLITCMLKTCYCKYRFSSSTPARKMHELIKTTTLLAPKTITSEIRYFVNDPWSALVQTPAWCVLKFRNSLHYVVCWQARGLTEGYRPVLVIDFCFLSIVSTGCGL